MTLKRLSPSGERSASSRTVLRYVSTLISIVVLSSALAACASQDSAREQSSSTAAALNVHLVGLWHVTSIQIDGQSSLRADPLTTAALTFRADGVLIGNGETCGAARFTASEDTITLKPTESTGVMRCESGRSGSELSLRIADIIDKVAAYESTKASLPIKYAIQDKERLIVTRGPYRVHLQRRIPVTNQPPVS